jgi:DNA-directed RNA polymerase subunit N (RpoN/RPB10)
MARICYLFPPVCSCSNFLGRIQYDFENLTQTGMSMVDAVTKLGFDRMCCRNQMLNVPLYFVQSSNVGRVTDRVGLIRPLINGMDNVFDTPDIPYTRKPPPFPALPGSLEFRGEEVVPQLQIQQQQGQFIPNLTEYLSTVPAYSSPKETITFGE